MTQAPEMARPAVDTKPAAPAAGKPGKPDPQAIAQMYLDGHLTGLEGREDEFGRAVLTAIKTLSDRHPYDHEMNDALVKSWLVGIKFAKKHDLLADYIENDVETLRPAVLKRMAELIRQTGEKEVALEAIVGWSTCHYHLVVTETYKEPGKRSFLSPFGRVLEMGHKLGIWDFDEQFVHENWFAPRAKALAADLGVPVEVSPWDPETRMVTVSLA